MQTNTIPTLARIRNEILNSSLEDELADSLVDIVDEIEKNPSPEAVRALGVLVQYLAEEFKQQSVLDTLTSISQSEGDDLFDK